MISCMDYTAGRVVVRLSLGRTNEAVMDVWEKWIGDYRLLLVIAALGAVSWIVGLWRASAKPVAARSASPTEVKDAIALSEPAGFYLVEHIDAGGAGWLLATLALYNIVMAAWLFLGAGSAFQETVACLMWIGGNQAMGFLLSMARRRTYEVRRLQPRQE